MWPHPVFVFQNGRLETQLKEQEITASQMELALRSEMATKDEQIGRLGGDIRLLEERLAGSQQQVAQREEQIAVHQASVRDAREETAQRQHLVEQLRVELNEVKGEADDLSDQVQRQELTLQQMEGDLQEARQQYRSAIEENGRLEARIEALAINAKTEQDCLSAEVWLHAFSHCNMNLAFNLYSRPTISLLISELLFTLNISVFCCIFKKVSVLLYRCSVARELCSSLNLDICSCKRRIVNCRNRYAIPPTELLLHGIH